MGMDRTGLDGTGTAGKGTGTAGVIGDAIESVAPLAPIQFGILYGCLGDASGTVYQGQWHAMLEGALDARALGRAWQAVVARHAILRTAFDWELKAEPLQIALRHVVADIAVVELDVATRARVADFLAQDRARGFDLAQRDRGTDQPPGQFIDVRGREGGGADDGGVDHANRHVRRLVRQRTGRRHGDGGAGLRRRSGENVRNGGACRWWPRRRLRHRRRQHPCPAKENQHAAGEHGHGQRGRCPRR